VLPRRWLLLPVFGVALGLLFAGQGLRAPESDDILEPLGLPGAREYRVLVVDDRDPAVMLLGTERGIFRTRDRGVRWRLAGLDGHSVTAVERRGTAYVAGGPGYAARSTDRGLTWRVVAAAPPQPATRTHGHAVGATAATSSPSEPRVAYAIGRDGQLYRSEDAGATWHVAG
jgi:photosystem II stability/assembly factor-like uncharacterized protein